MQYIRLCGDRVWSGRVFWLISPAFAEPKALGLIERTLGDMIGQQIVDLG